MDFAATGNIWACLWAVPSKNGAVPSGGSTMPLSLKGSSPEHVSDFSLVYMHVEAISSSPTAYSFIRNGPNIWSVGAWTAFDNYLTRQVGEVGVEGGNVAWGILK